MCVGYNGIIPVEESVFRRRRRRRRRKRRRLSSKRRISMPCITGIDNFKIDINQLEETNIQWDAPLNLVSHPTTDLARLNVVSHPATVHAQLNVL